MKIISKSTHSYAGKLRRPGASYEATKEHAKFLVGLGVAEYPKGETVITSTPEVATPKREYETRQVKAEDKDARAADAERTRREYKRRDMKSED